MDWERAKPLLDAKLDPSHVKKGGGQFGPKGDFIEGWLAIQEANRIFGYGGWSYTIELRQDDLREVTTAKGQPQWQAAYTCICTVRVGDVTRQDVGFGSGFAKGIGDAIEGATKESATDALKRCLRTFGNPFGLALYDKSRENVGRDEPPPPAAPRPLSQQAAAPAPRQDAPAARTLKQVVDGMRAAIAGTPSRVTLRALFEAGPFSEDYKRLRVSHPEKADELDLLADERALELGGGADDRAFEKRFLDADVMG